jgi:GT2 family glycosyltransferase
MIETVDAKPEAKPRPVSILIPTHGAAEMLLVCLESLVRQVPADCTVYVLDDATPNDSIRRACEGMQSRFPQLSYHRSDVNRGFVGTCNWGNENLRRAGTDLLLLNSDTEVTPGFLEEMQAVLYLHKRHAVVTPRSNNATTFSVPWVGGALPANDSYQVWEQIRNLLPRYQVMPTAVGFCMLIKAEILARFGLFDEVYAPGYNEENDFVCRINRCGYSALSANWAYVFHYGNSSFGPRRAKLEAVNHGILLERYPEYDRKVAEYIRSYVDPVETFARLYAPHRPRLLFDLFHPPSTEASQFALNLLRGISEVLEDEFELYVGVEQSQASFDNELAGYRLYDDHEASMTFDLAFRPSQILTWGEFQRINRLAPRVSYVLLDVIGVRCGHLNTPDRQILFHKAAELSNCVFTISDFSRTDFDAFYGSEVPMRVIHRGTNSSIADGKLHEGEYVLLVGDSCSNKDTADVLQQLNRNLSVVVLGRESPTAEEENVRWLSSGTLSRQEVRNVFAKARVLVFPSHDEGFALLAADALALGKPVIVLDTTVNRELTGVVDDRDLHRIASVTELSSTLECILEREMTLPEIPPWLWRETAAEYVAAFCELLAQDVDIPRLRARWELIRTLESKCSL